MRIYYILTLLLVLGFSKTKAQQSFGIGTDSPDANAIFEAQSTDKGILIPRMNTTQRNAISGLGVSQEGLLIYNTLTDEFNYWDGTAWVSFPSASLDDIDFYEVGTTTAPNAITDNIFTQGNVGIGETTPNAALHVNGGSIPLRVEVVGVETMRLNNNTLEFLNTNNSVFLGEDAGLNNVTGTGNVAVGTDALGNNTTGTNNVAVGHGALSAQINGGIDNVAVGRYAFFRNTTGDYGVAIGANALSSNTTGTLNTAIGANALLLNSSGFGNTAIGYLALRSNNANDNIAIGTNAMVSNTTGTGNISIGNSSNQLSSTGNYNTIIGYRANFTNVNGNNNTMIGYEAGYGSSGTNSGNVFIGYQAGRNINTDDRLYIDNSSTSSPLIYGEFDNNMIRINGELQVNDPSTFGYALPFFDGTAGYIMQTNGAGSVSWIDPATLTSAPEWTDVGASIHPADGITEEVTIGTLTAGSAKLTINANEMANGIEVSKTSSSPSLQVGLDVDLDNGSGGGGTIGIDNSLTGTGGNLRYGVRTNISGSTSGGTTGHYGASNTISSSGAGARYGIANEISGSGTGTKYGTYNVIENTSGGTSHRAVYGEALKAGSNIFAGYFLGNVGIGTTTGNIYTLPASRGTNGYIMQTNGSGIVSWVDPATLSSDDADWFVYNTTNAPTSINDNIYTQGNVGIGTTTPLYNLHIEAGTEIGVRLNGSGTTSNYTMIVHNSAGRAAKFQTGGVISGWTSANVAVHAVAQGVGAIGGFFTSDNTGSAIFGQSQGSGNAVEGWAFGTGRAGYFHGGEVLISDGLEANNGAVFNENSFSVDFRVEGNTQTNLLFIDGSTDNIGIGTGTPTSRLQVEGGAVFNETSADVDFRIEGDTDANLFFIDASNDNIGIGTITPSSSSKLNIVSTDFAIGLDIDHASNNYNSYQGVTLNVDNNYNIGTTSTYGILAQTRSTNSYTNAGNITGLYSAAQDYQTNATVTDQRSIIGLYGSSYVNSTNGVSNSRGVYGTTSGGGDVEYGGYFIGDVYASGVYTTSDIHLKQNINPYTGALSKIQALNTVTYQYKNDRYPLLNLPEGPQIGLIAQEVEKVFPNMVKRADETPQTMPIQQAIELGLAFKKTETEGMVEVGEHVEILAVNYTNLVPVLIKAMQEQQATIEQLEQRITELEK